jgi:hypothetical protein
MTYEQAAAAYREAKLAWAEASRSGKPLDELARLADNIDECEERALAALSRHFGSRAVVQRREG